MGLADRHRELAEADLALKEFLGDSGRLRTLREWKAQATATPAEEAVLDGWMVQVPLIPSAPNATDAIARASRENAVASTAGLKVFMVTP